MTLFCRTLAIVCCIIPQVSLAQIASPGDLDPSGRVYTEIVARVGAAGSNSPAIPGMAVYVVSEDGRRTTLRTTLGGTAAAWLARARYRIVTPDPFQYQERLYSWDTIVVVRGGIGPIRLQLENAKSRPVPLMTWKANEVGARVTITNGRVMRTLSLAGVSANAAATRNDNLITVELTLANRSSHNVDYDPRDFTLKALTPAEKTLSPWIPKSGILSAPTLSSGRLAPGQSVTGLLYFEPDSKARDVVLRVPVSRVTFEFPLVLR
ncbi:MAG TPA: hypothetical protein VM099_00750 [Gemmatimonadaceae bacterium]|nr:hypothetical protein [Gemmatimonadaceae bacterium]